MLRSRNLARRSSKSSSKRRTARFKKPVGVPAVLCGVRFRNRRWLEAALTHPSFRNENPAAPPLEDFDRMEFFGDSILDFVICRRLYKLYPKANEGLLSRLRSIIVSRKILSRIAQELRLSPSLKLGKSLRAQFSLCRAKISTDSLEALFAAIYFDQGFESAEKFILKHFSQYFDAKRLFRLDPNPKSTLQELAQKQWRVIPSYSSQLHEKGMRTEVIISPSRKAIAMGRTRQEAEEKAARFLVRKIRQELLRRSKKRSSSRK